jgi:cytochrome c-type biogenesis protein CcmF
VLDRVRGVRSGVLAQFARQPRSFWGMILAHLGVAVFIVGVTLVKGYETERDVRMAVGDTVTVGAHTFRFDGVTERRGPNFRATRGTFTVTRDGAQVDVMHPEKRIYNAGGMPMTEAAIDPGLFGDLYVSLGEPVDGGAWSVRVYHKPFVTWIWFGCIIMAIGGVLALSDRRYRIAQRREATVPGAAPGAAGAD